MDETYGELELSRSKTPADRGDGLSFRERETAGQLRLLDPHLAGLYERRLALAREIDEPGNAYDGGSCWA